MEVEKFLEFLAIFLKIRRLSDSQAFEVIYRFCRQPLAEGLLKERAQTMSFEEFHRLVFQNIFVHRCHGRFMFTDQVVAR